MDFLTALTFTGAIFIFMAIPGPGIVIVISRSLGSGFKHAIFMVGGKVLGNIIFLLLSIFGLAFIASSMSTLFGFIKIAGGLYLIYLGIKMFLTKTSYFDISLEKKPTYSSDFFSGLLSTLGNPKIIAFYIGFLPTFVNLSKMASKDIFLVTLLVLAASSTVMTAYAYFASKLRETIKKPKTQNIMNKSTGAVLVLMGGLLIAKE